MNGDNNDLNIQTGTGAPPAGGPPGGDQRQAPTPPPVPPRQPATPPTPPTGSDQGQPDFFSPDTFSPSPIPAGAEEDTKKKGVFATILTILIILVIVGGVGALGYFVVFPLVFPPQVSEPGTQLPPTGTEPAIVHQSFLVTPPSAEAEVELGSDLSYLSIANGLQNESFNQLADNQIKEIKISSGGSQVAFSSYLTSVTPVASALGAADWFEDDFTALFYYDANGVWPIYVAKLKSGISSEMVTGGFRQIEDVLDVGNFYISAPGSFGGFNDGSAVGTPTRYSVGSQAGAAFNYGVFGDFFIVATNYNGLLGVLPKLGL